MSYRYDKAGNMLTNHSIYKPGPTATADILITHKTYDNFNRPLIEQTRFNNGPIARISYVYDVPVSYTHLDVYKRQGVGMLSDVIAFYPYRQSFATICRGLEHGELFSTCVARFPALYDRKLSALIRVGEETNRLPEMLRRQGEALTEELEFRIKRMGSLLEPALIMLVGLLVAVILISMYMPMFRLGGIMG